jgi:hypothetical protein
MPARSADDRRAIASIAALSRSAREGGADRLAAANRAYRDSFNRGHKCAMCPPVEIDQGLPADEIARRGTALYKIHMRRLALKRTRSQRLAAELAAIEAADAGLAGLAAAE